MRDLLKALYRSPFGRIMSFWASIYARLHTPFMVYGYYDSTSRRFQKFTRISSSAVIMNKSHLSVGNNVWVWHYSILDATEGLSIEEGCQIGAWVGIFTHGSEHSIRLLGQNFVHIHHSERKGYTRGRVRIGAYTFIGAGSVILPGVNIGKGCLISAGSLGARDVPDYSIVAGRPGKIVGSTVDSDSDYFKEMGEIFAKTYYDSQALIRIQHIINNTSNGSNLSTKGEIGDDKKRVPLITG